MDLTAEQIEIIARACHEVNLCWCLYGDDYSQVHWEDAPENIRESARAGVKIAAAGATPEQQHGAWCEFKIADGWIHGPVKDAEAKIHPCLVPYDQLPPAQRVKDTLYIGVVRLLVNAMELA